jgi:hypothetical protein
VFLFELENTGGLLLSVLGLLIIGRELPVLDFVLDLNEGLESIFVFLGQFEHFLFNLMNFCFNFIFLSEQLNVVNVSCPLLSGSVGGGAYLVGLMQVLLGL